MGLNLSITTVDEMDQGEVVDVQGEIISFSYLYYSHVRFQNTKFNTYTYITTLCALIVSLLYIKSI